MSRDVQTCGLCNDKLDGMDATLKKIHDRLFVDNGTPCIQTRLDRHDTAISVIRWVTATAGGAIICGLVALFIKGS